LKFTWLLTILFEYNIDNKVTKHVNQFSTREMQLTSRSSED